MMPLRIQRRRTKGWRMPPNYVTMASSCNGQKGSRQSLSLVFPAASILAGSQKMSAPQPSTRSITKKGELGTTNIAGKRGRLIPTSLTSLLPSGGHMTRGSTGDRGKNSSCGLVVSVRDAGLTIFDAYKLTIEMAVVTKSARSMDGNTSSSFTDYPMKNLGRDIKSCVPTATR